MKIKVLCFFLFLFFCDLIAKDMNFDLQGQVADKSSVVIDYSEARFNFTVESLAIDRTYENICTVSFNTNVKAPVELVLSSTDFIDDGFAFCDKDNKPEFKFYLTSAESGEKYGNNAVIFTKSEITEPISNVLNMGMFIPAADSSKLHGGDFSIDFTIVIKNLN